MAKNFKKVVAYAIVLTMLVSAITLSAFAALDLTVPGENRTWDEATKTLTLNAANITESVSLPDGSTIVVNGDSSIAGGDSNAITCAGSLTVKGKGKLTLTGSNGIKAASVSIDGIKVDFTGTSCGIQVVNNAGDAKVTLTNVDGSISGGYAGIYVNGECTETEASVIVDGCDLKATSTATSWNNRARKAGITVYVSTAEKVESSITINNSKVNATGFDAGLSINNYLGDNDATNSASARINITNSTVVAHGTSGTWSGIFASVLGKHPDADSIITITNSSVYAVSPNTGILTSSQYGESKIILDNSILGASGSTALSMIESTAQAQTAELKNGSTYVQMTPAAVLKGEIVNFEGKTFIATAGSGITYDAEKNCFVVPQGSTITEVFTDGTTKEYTFNNQAGGIGGEGFEKEELWGYDKDKWLEGDIVIYTPEELIEFSERTQEGGDLGDCADRNVYLGDDIDMSEYYWYYRNAEGTVVFDRRIPKFSGVFNGEYLGKKYTIKNLKYRDDYKEATDVVSLAFILESHNAPTVVTNLTIDGITVDTVAPAQFAGLIDHYTYWEYTGNCGSVSNVTVSNITVNSANKLVFGGMFHKLLGSPTITNCHVVNFTVNAKGALSGANTGRCGGFFATGGEGGTVIDRCSVNGFAINTSSVINYVGGFAGGVSGMTYKNCSVNDFSVIMENKNKTHRTVGGFIGYTEGTGWNLPLVVDNCSVNNMKLDLGVSSTSTDKKGNGGFIGLFNNSYAGITISNCYATGAISVAGDMVTGGFIGQSYKAPAKVQIIDCKTTVNIYANGFAGGFVGNYALVGGKAVTYTNCTASGDVFGLKSEGSFMDADATTVDGIIGGTYNYVPESVASGYRALNNGNGTWTVFPDLGLEVVTINFHVFDASGNYVLLRSVEVFKGANFFNAAHNNHLNYSHPTYRFPEGLTEIEKNIADFTFWTNTELGTVKVLDNYTVIEGDMNVYVGVYPTYTVTYTWNLPSDTGVALPTDDKAYSEGDVVDVTKLFAIGDTVKIGNDTYKFMGWNTEALVDGKMPAADVVITGVWEKVVIASDYIITFDKSAADKDAFILYVDQNGNIVSFEHKKALTSPLTVEGKEGLVSVVYIPKEKTGWLWTSDAVSDDVISTIHAYLKKNINSYKGYGGSGCGEGDFNLKTHTYHVKRYSAELSSSDSAPAKLTPTDTKDLYYSNLAAAIADANAFTFGANADANKKNAVACLSVKKGTITVQLLKDTVITETIYPTVDMTIELDGHRIGYTCAAAIKTVPETPVNLTINGKKKGSIIENEGRLQGRIRALFIEVGSVVTINGGTYKGIGDYPSGYATLPQGILNCGTLYINDAHVIGTHTGLQSEGPLYIKGGTFEGYGHGGIYFVGDNVVSYVRDAVITECDIPEGYVNTAGKNGAAFYVGGGSNMKVYLDNCKIIGSKRHFVLRTSSSYKEKNNTVYLSNCKVATDADILVRIDDAGHQVYIGKGCNFTAKNTNRPDAVVVTKDIYRLG